MTGTEQLLALIEARRAELGLTQSQLGQRAFGRADTSAIQNLKRGASPTFDRLDALANALGLELYFGPPRDRSVAPQIVPDQSGDFAQVPLHEAELAAGDGTTNHAETVIAHLAFRRDWLKRIGVAPSAARLARVHGESMQPTLMPGDMVMIDTSRRNPPVRLRSGKDRRRSTIYAIVEQGEARIKRIERPEEGQLLLLSDNPEFAPELRQGEQVKDVKIIGKVVWWGHTVKE